MNYYEFDKYETNRNNHYGNRGWLVGTELHPDNDLDAEAAPLRIVYVHAVEADNFAKMATDIKIIKLSDIITLN
jgi:hypothetical protein